MIPDAFRLRQIAVAYVFPAQPHLRREDGLAFYDRVTSAGIEVPQFNSQRNVLQLLRVGSGEPTPQFQLEVGHHQGSFRLIIAEVWPNRSLDLIRQDADIAWDCFTETWTTKQLGGSPVLVEANIRLDIPADGGDATRYLLDRSLHLSHRALTDLGRSLQGIGLKLFIPVEVRASAEGEKEMPLAGADVRIEIETLLDDPSRIYMQQVCKWPSVPIPSEVREQTGAPERLNPKAKKPSSYITDVYEYATRRVGGFLSTAARE